MGCWVQIVAFERDACSPTGSNPALAVVRALIHCILCQGKPPVYFCILLDPLHGVRKAFLVQCVTPCL